MQILNGKRILLGVCGSIAAYKSAELIRLFKAEGAVVRVVMTESAKNFITALTLQALSGLPVRSGLMDAESEAAMGHIELARWSDLVLVAPASQDFIARLAQGRADDLLTTLCAVTDAPVVLAPAMNHSMWTHSATLANREKLAGRGVVIVEPGVGDMACGEYGPGRLASSQQLLAALHARLQSGALAGLTVLVTAGPTQERLDPVRFLSNRSSGKMGFALASAAQEAGAKVILISGPVSLPTPDRVARVDIISACEMRDAVLAHLNSCDILIGAAAVADYQPVKVEAQKIKKDTASLVLELEQTPDILTQVRQQAADLFIVGFAAETENLAENAQRKLLHKQMNMVAANQVGDKLGFDQEDNALQVYWPDGSRLFPKTSKSKLARQLLALIAEIYNAKSTT